MSRSAEQRAAGFTIVGLPDKAVGESRERVRAALARHGPGAAAAAHHRQPRARRPRQGGQPLRPADRARRCWRRWACCRRDERRGLHRRWASWRSTARSCRSPACCRRRSPRPSAGCGLICPAACGGEAAWARRRSRSCAAPHACWRSINHFARHAAAAAARAAAGADDRAPAPTCRRQGPGDRQARARDRRRGRPQPADDRPARLRQVDAGGAAARHPAAARAGRGAGGLDDPLARRRLLRAAAAARRRPFRDPHHSASLPALVGGGAQRPAGRGLARPSRRAVPRRAARVQPRGAGSAAPAAGDRPASASPAPTRTSPIPRASSSWRR